jgi:hypothetical protein
MGTRADFYVGTGVNAEWIGSVAWDGYEWSEDKDNLISSAASEAGFRVAVASMLEAREDGIKPIEGWPWPWEDSRTTDYAYCFDGQGVQIFCFGRPVAEDGDCDYEAPKVEFPDMTAAKNVQLGDKSGCIIISTSGKP